jgi:hypothetical protein
MVTTQHSFIAATILAHRDVLAAFRAMPQLACSVAAVLVVQVLLEMVLKRIVPYDSLLGRDLANVVYYALLTPFFIAVHRFIILGEVTPHYRLRWQELRFQLFFGCAFILFALSQAPRLIIALPKHWMIHVAVVAIAVAVCVALTRVTILFPAIAVDAPGATPRNAFDDTRGHGWYIFFLFLFSFIPSVVVVIVLAALTALIPEPLLGGLALLVVVWLGAIVWLTLAVVLASRLYRSFGNRLNQPA